MFETNSQQVISAARADSAGQHSAGTFPAVRSLADWFGELRELGPVRVISPCGPSVFETICEITSYGVAEGHLNAMTSAYHWHLDISRVARIRSRDDVHARSGRRVLFFELFEEDAVQPFVLVYLHRAKGEEFTEARLARFAQLNSAMAQGLELERRPETLGQDPR